MLTTWTSNADARYDLHTPKQVADHFRETQPELTPAVAVKLSEFYAPRYPETARFFLDVARELRG